jgi:hypothetical protein
MKYVLALLLSLPALAQTNVTRYYADECKVIAKDVYVAPKGLSYIEFYDAIDQDGVISPGVARIVPDQQQPMTAPFIADKTDGSNVLNITTTLTGGNSDLVVWVKGEPCNLRLVIKPDLVGPQRYIIERTRPLPALTNDSTFNTNLKGSLEFQVISATAISDGTTTIHFSFTNRSERVVSLDTARVTFKQNDDPLAVEVRKTPLTPLVEPGKTHSGFVLVKGVSSGVGQLSWTVVGMGGGEEVKFDETVTVPASR